MCGIFGIVSKEEIDAGAAMYAGLKCLEYRGYDSTGMAVLEGKGIEVRKEGGALDRFEAAFGTSMRGRIGISHVRWATHGGVTKENAHPHTSCDGKIALVHNGIIENYKELKARLLEKGHKFSSETDSETAAHLFEENLKLDSSAAEAFRLTANALQGSYAILAMVASEPGRIFAAKNESPLALGIGSGEVVLASDTMPISKYAQEAVFFEDGEIAVAESGKYGFYEAKSGRELKKQPTKIAAAHSSEGKGGYDFYMLKEILEQPQAMKRTLGQDPALIKEFSAAMKAARGVMIIASGTSLHAAMAAQYIFDKKCRMHVNVINASEFEYLEHSLHEASLVIAVSQSGETADLMSALKTAKQKGTRIFSIVNVVGSSIARLSEKTIYLNSGPEIAVASTKAFTSELAVFCLLACELSGDAALKRALLELPEDMLRCIDTNQRKAAEIAKQLAESRDMYYIGRSVYYPIALEGALKMKEISYVHAEGMPAGELKHGTLALVSKGVPVIAVNPSGETFAAGLSNIIETKARGSFVVGVSDKEDGAFDAVLKVPKVHEELFPFLCILPLQLLAYYAAVQRGLDPDKPRNLAKSVTVK